MKKVLICLPGLEKTNGIATLFMNNIFELNNRGYLLDFYIPGEYDNDINYLKTINKSGGKVYNSSNHSKLKKYTVVYNDLMKIIEDNSYDLIHINLINIYAYACINASKKSKIKNIIFHVHNPIERGNLFFLSDILTLKCCNKSNHLIACTNLAGKSNFKEKEYDLIHNAIDINKYQYDLKFRKKFRNEYHLNNSFVIGCIGRLSKQKNPFFTLKVFYELQNKYKNLKLLFIGNGELESSVKNKCFNNDDILFLGSRNDMNKIYSALDLLFLPSLYEGLGIVFIEAQVSNLPVITSTNTPLDILIADNIERIDLKENVDYWCNTINRYIKMHTNRKNNFQLICDSGYSLNSGKYELIDIYDNYFK